MSSLSRGQCLRPDWASSSASDLHVPSCSGGQCAVMVRVTAVWRLYRTEGRRQAFGLPRSRENWRRNLALTYAVSAWSMIGFVAYMHWRNKDTEVVERPKTDDQAFLDLEEDPLQRRKQRIEFSAQYEYKENSVPYTTRIYQYFTSSDKKSDSSSTEN